MGWTSLRTNLARGARVRSILTLAGVAAAVWLGAMMLGVGEGVYRDSVALANEMGLDRILVQPRNRATAAADASADAGVLDASWRLTAEDAAAIREQVANVRAVSPAKLFFANVRRNDVVSEMVVKAYVDFGQKEDRGRYGYRLGAGEHISRQDDDGLERVALLGADYPGRMNVREQLFPGAEDPLGQDIFIDGIAFKVKGYYEGFVDFMVQVPFKTASALLTNRREVNEIYVFVEDADRIFETASDIRDIGIRLRGKDAYSIFHPGQDIQAAKEFRGQLRLVLGVIAAIVLLATNLSLMNIKLVSIKARYREIGIRMAVGARRRDILWQFFSEAMVLSVAGALIGAFAATASVPVLQAFGVPVAYSTAFLAIPVTGALLAGALFSIAPARRAAQLDPSAALASD